jgi:hypothetical protein
VLDSAVSSRKHPKSKWKVRGRDDEAIDGDNVTGMRLKEGAPWRRRPWREAPHVLGNGETGDLIAEDPRRRA